jgi:hypothetical protein
VGYRYPGPVSFPTPMRSAVLAAFFCLASLAGAAPAPGDVAVVAAARLAEKSNYTWTSTIQNDESGGLVRTEGRTVRGGYTLMMSRNPPEFLRSRGAVRDGEGAIQVWFRGADRCVILTEEGWLTPEELPAAQPGSDPSGARNPARNAARGGRGASRAAPSSVPTRVEDHTFEIRHPHEELDLIIGGYTTLRSAGNTFAGELTEAGAALFLRSFAQPRVHVRRAGGSFRCWIENGVVVRYEVQITATVNLPGDRNQLPVSWTISTEITDIGTTRLTVPAAVRAKLP